MAKSSKKSKEATAPKTNRPVHGMKSSNGNGGDKSTRPAGGKKVTTKSGLASAAAKPRGATTRKAAASRKAQPVVTPAARSRNTPAILDEQIRTRAYFIAEWRLQNGIAGNSEHDWIEARRQLQEEAQKGV
ncbi:hypothetical protein BH20VER3_BH20VER3_14370 [soil metagenome]